jgi:hypothetical protein
MGREEAKAMKKGKEGRRKGMTWPSNKIPGSATADKLTTHKKGWQ